MTPAYWQAGAFGGLLMLALIFLFPDWSMWRRFGLFLVLSLLWTVGGAIAVRQITEAVQ